MRKLFLFMIIASAVLIASANAQIEWNGYVQVRAFNSDPANGFELRRTKLWFKGQTPVDGLSYKLQTLYSWKGVGALVLQDIFLQYKLAPITFKAGQFVPKYSLQWSQPDALIPISERAKPIDALIPTAQTMARDIGLEMAIAPWGGLFTTYFGAYNGKGFNLRPKTDKDFMVTNRTIINLPLGFINVHVGGSAAYREIHDAQFSKIMGSAKMFSGIDRRYAVETRLYGPGWSLQGEYLKAEIGNIEADGWYLLAAANVTNKDILAVSVERLNDQVATTIDKPWYILVYSHLFDKHNIKLMFDNRFQREKETSYYKSILQMQVFFNPTKQSLSKRECRRF